MPGYFDQRVSSSEWPPMPYDWEADDSTQTWILQRLQTYQFYVYEEHCELVRKLHHGLTVSELNQSGFGDYRILALWPRGRTVPDEDEHAERYRKNHFRGTVDSAECLYPKLSRRQKVLNKLAHSAEHRLRGPISHIDELDEPYLDLKWYEKHFSDAVRTPKWVEKQCVLLYDRPPPDEPDHVAIETIRDALLGIR